MGLFDNDYDLKAKDFFKKLLRDSLKTILNVSWIFIMLFILLSLVGVGEALSDDNLFAYYNCDTNYSDIRVEYDLELSNNIFEVNQK